MAKQISIFQVRLERVAGFKHEYDQKQIRLSYHAEEIFRDYFNQFCNTDRENFMVMYLNAKNKITGISTAHVGSINASIVHPREIFTEAVLHKAVSMIVCHNHPSGDPTPSGEDISVTKMLQRAGELLNIEVLDHIILGEESFISLKEKGCM